MKLYEIYFSPTGGTKKAVKMLGNAWDCEKKEVDLSDPKTDVSECKIEKEDVCIVAVPSFGGRMPEMAAERIAMLKGNGAKAVFAAVYGNRAFEDTLIELKDLLHEAGFFCAAAAGIIAEHSIVRTVGAGRPNAEDEKELREFGSKIQAALAEDPKEEVNVPGNHPYKEFKVVPMVPFADETCTKCGLCAAKCPAQAISFEDPSRTDAEKCISCMRCISVCTKKARHKDEKVLSMLTQKLEAACASPKKNELFI